MKKGKILVITPRFPFDLRGACEQDRAHGIALLTKLGYEVHVITMCYKSHLALCGTAEKEYGISITPILYSSERRSFLDRILALLKRIVTPVYWDGAAYEYADTETQRVVQQIINDFQPQLLWVDYTYMWPLYGLAHARNIPIVTRSVNFEPDHFYNKTSKDFMSWLKYRAKHRSERRVLAESDWMFVITPKEERVYRAMGAQHISTLPLRRLGILIGKNPEVHTKEKLDVFFMGSNYSVHHMMQALRFILDEVNPLLQQAYPDTFTIHVLGGKLPEQVKNESHKGIVFHGYVPDLNAFLEDMDIALSPSLSGEGMQQKVFEPIVRGIPTITSERALAGYPFLDTVQVRALKEDTPEAFVNALGTLISEDVRRKMSSAAIQTARTLFNEEKLKDCIDRPLQSLISRQ